MTRISLFVSFIVTTICLSAKAITSFQFKQCNLNLKRIPATSACISRTSLALKKGQGSQLVAAWTVSCIQKEERDTLMNAMGGVEEKILTKNRSFISRVFDLPSVVPSFMKETKDDGVLYPLVGFRFVKDGPDHCRALPPPGSSTIESKDDSDEEVFGWFTPGCHLELSDEENYCSDPEQQNRNLKMAPQ